MMPSLSAKFFYQVVKLYGYTDGPGRSVRRQRGRFEFLTRFVGIPRGVGIHPEKIAGRYGEWIVPSGTSPLPAGCGDRPLPAGTETSRMNGGVGKDFQPVVLYFHGGSYIMGSAQTHRLLASELARVSQSPIYLSNYRLAPENPFPAAVEDACAVYRELLGRGYTPQQICLAGDSAGGGLTMAALVALRDAGDPLPAAAAVLSPWTDLAATGETLRTREGVDPLFHAWYVPHWATYYVGKNDPRNPLISPVFADLHGLPPVLIQVGDCEILLSDSTRLHENLLKAGSPSTLKVWDGMWHVFQAFAEFLPESCQALNEIAQFLRAQTSS
jgi:acetyl esterase/lipase